MKKVALTLAGLLTAAAFAPEASALPVFARQTGMACSACHFQHFPLLNGFGRAFKASGFTLMGAQGKVEGEHLSIPDRLNMAVLTTAGWEHTTGVNVAMAGPYSGTAVKAAGAGGEAAMFFGGRVSENIGFLSEIGSATKMPMMYEVGSIKAGAVIVAGGQGQAHSLELLNTGAAGVHRMVPMPGGAKEHINANSAAQYLGTKSEVVGVSAVAVGDNFFVNAGKYAVLPAAAGLVAQGVQGTSKNLNSNYLRAAAMFDLAGFDSAVGVQAFGGSDATGAMSVTQATVFDAQMQGEVSGMGLGLYASYGTAPKQAVGGLANEYNVHGAAARTSLNIAAELGVIPGTATVMGAMRFGKNGALGATGAALTDNAMMVGATYELAQNVEMSFSYTTQSGTAWDTANAGVNPANKSTTSIMIEALF